MAPANSEHQAMEQNAIDHYRKARKRSDDENNLQPPSKRVSRSRSPMTSSCPSPNSITVKDRESVLVGATSALHPDAAMQELELEDGLAVTLSCEMDVLYDPLQLNESRTRVTPQNEASTLNIEYDLPSLFPSSVKDV